MGSAGQSPRCPPAPDAEVAQVAGSRRRLQSRSTRSTMAPAGPSLHGLEQHLERRARGPSATQRTRAVRLVRDPAGQPEIHRPRGGRSSGTRRPGRGRAPIASRRVARSTRWARPRRRSRQRQRRAAAARRAPGRRAAAPATRSRRAGPRRGQAGRGRRRASVGVDSDRGRRPISSSRPRSRTDRVEAAPTEREVARDVRPQAEQGLGRAPSFGRRGPRGWTGLVFGILTVRRRSPGRASSRMPEAACEGGRRAAAVGPGPSGRGSPPRSARRPSATERARRRADPRDGHRAGRAAIGSARHGRAGPPAGAPRRGPPRGARRDPRQPRGQRRVRDVMLVRGSPRPPAVPTGPSRRRAQRERIVGQQGLLGVRAEDERHPGRRLLEGLEQRRLGVLVHAMGALR